MSKKAHLDVLCFIDVHPLFTAVERAHTRSEGSNAVIHGFAELITSARMEWHSKPNILQQRPFARSIICAELYQDVIGVHGEGAVPKPLLSIAFGTSAVSRTVEALCIGGLRSQKAVLQPVGWMTVESPARTMRSAWGRG